MKILKDKLEKRGGLINDMKEIVSKADAEKRGLNDEEQTRWDALDTDQEALKKDVDTLQKQEALDKEADEERENIAVETGTDPEKRVAAHKAAFRHYLSRGETEITSDERKILTEERANQVVGTTTAGGYLVPEGFQVELEKALLPYVKMWDFARILKTNTGGDIPWPTMNDTTNKGELLAEAAAYGNEALVFGSVTLKDYTFTSKVVTVSYQLLQDSALPIESVVIDALAERVGRILNQYYTTGTGSGQPEGIVTNASDSGEVSLIAGPTRDNIVGLYHSLNADYRKNGVFMFEDSILKALKLLEIGTADARPLWQPSMRVGEPDTIEGKQYIINDEMASLGSGNTIMLFGDFKKFIIRQALDFNLLRLNELYAANLLVGFVGYMRASSHALNAGTNPIKQLACGTT